MDTKSEEFYIVECPWCSQSILVMKSEINCTIFRCGVIKNTGQQLEPHSPKSVCDYMVENDMIYGCGKPFQFNGYQAVKCGYI